MAMMMARGLAGGVDLDHGVRLRGAALTLAA